MEGVVCGPGGRYKVLGAQGRGVFSTVMFCVDQVATEQAARKARRAALART